MSAKQRLALELKKFSPNEEVLQLGPENDEDMYLWKAVITGPKETPYESGKFKIQINMTTEYPWKPPVVKMLTRTYHPNINAAGSICMDILDKEWSPAITLEKLVISIRSLLSDPNPEDPMAPIVAAIFKTNPEQYRQTTTAYTKMYAM